MSLLSLIATELAQFLRVLAPHLFLIASLVWVYRSRSVVSILGLLGAIHAFLALYLRNYVPSVHSVVAHGMEPAPDQNAFIHYFYLHGDFIGYGVLSIAFLWHVSRLPRVVA